MLLGPPVTLWDPACCLDDISADWPSLRSGALVSVQGTQYNTTILQTESFFPLPCLLKLESCTGWTLCCRRSSGSSSVGTSEQILLECEADTAQKVWSKPDSTQCRNTQTGALTAGSTLGGAMGHFCCKIVHKEGILIQTLTFLFNFLNLLSI